jgi:hypothetical protein
MQVMHAGDDSITQRQQLLEIARYVTAPTMSTGRPLRFNGASSNAMPTPGPMHS